MRSKVLIRAHPDAFLASSVVVCEGASEVGLIRGLDQYFTATGIPSVAAKGAALVDAGGCDKLYGRVNAFTTLGYRTAVLRDDDKQPDTGLEAAFVRGGGKLCSWRRGRALEDELFLSLTNGSVLKLLDYAADLHGENMIDANIRSASRGTLTLAACRANISADVRSVLGRASRTRQGGWLKSVTWMEHVGREIVGPDLEQADGEFRDIVHAMFYWMHDDAGARA